MNTPDTPRQTAPEGTHCTTLTLAQWLAQAPFTLTMSSGFFSFFAHLGMLQALEQFGLMPARVTGSSAGALTAACWSAHQRCQPLEEQLMALERQAFWDPAPGLGLLRGRKFREVLRDLLAAEQFSDLKTPLAVSVWSLKQRDTVVIDTGDVVEAVYASCAVPLLFQPGYVNQSLCWDGGIADRHGLQGTTAQERVLYHHISSRSPWRSKSSPALQIPQRHSLRSLTIQGLPRSGPHRLDQGKKAIRLACDATRRALDMPFTNGQVSVSV